MATNKPKGPKPPPVRMVRRMIPADALVWRPSQPLNDQLNRIVDERANEATEQALQVFEQERVKGLMGGWKGNISDFMYSLVGYLTTRNRPLIFSRKHGAASIAELMGEIAKANELPPTSENEKWPKLKVTDDMEGYTNDPELSPCKVARDPLTPSQALTDLMRTVEGMSAQDQETAIASFLSTLQRQRQLKLTYATNTMKKMEDGLAKAQEDYWNMEKVARGDFRLLTVEIPGSKDGAHG